MNKNYIIISRWMQKTLLDWHKCLELNGNDVLLYEEYIDSTANFDHFNKFVILLSKQCPKLTHVRLLFSGENSDMLEFGFVQSTTILPNLRCLSLFNPPKNEIYSLKSHSNQLTTLKLSDIDKQVTLNDLDDVFRHMNNLRCVVYDFQSPIDNVRVIPALQSISSLKDLTLYFPPESELKCLGLCKKLEILTLHNVSEKLDPADFLKMLEGKRKLNTLSISFVDPQVSFQWSKLDLHCPEITYLSINMPLKSFGDFQNLKYLRFEIDDKFDVKEMVELLTTQRSDGLMVLDISGSKNHTHTSEISRLKSLKAFLCSSWSEDKLQYVSQLEDLELFSLEKNIFNSGNNDTLLTSILDCKKLKYLRLPFNTDMFKKIIQLLPDQLSDRGFGPQSSFILSTFNQNAVAEIEEKLNEQPHRNLLQLDWNGNLFASKLKGLVRGLSDSACNLDENIVFKFPGKVAGDSMNSEDIWLTSRNYQIAIKSCTNKFNLAYDEEMIKRCRNFAIDNTEHNISNMQYAFNFKYDALDEHNELPEHT